VTRGLNLRCKYDQYNIVKDKGRSPIKRN